jgi:guanylate kinase
MDYTFLTMDEFMKLEKSGNLLESGIYDGKPDFSLIPCPMTW